MKHKILGVAALLCAMLFAACSDLLEDLTPKETSSVEVETTADTDLYVNILEISGDFTLESEQSGTELRFTALDTEPGANLVWKVYKGLEDTAYTQSGSDTSFGFDTGDLEPGKYTLLVTSGTRSATVVFTVNTTVTVPVTLKTGDAINSILMQLCPDEYGDGSACTKFARSETNKDEATLYLDTEGKYIPVWSEDTVVYYYVPDGCTPVMNEDSSKMFYGCTELTSLDVTGFDTSNVTDMSEMFYYCSKLTSLDVTGFDTSNVTNMSSMFAGCSKLTELDVSKFVTSKVENMTGMFSSCSGLTSLDVSKFDTSKVTSMLSMFAGCSKLTELDVSKFVTSKVENMSGMFGSCSDLNSLDVSKFDTGNVTDMSGMFARCSGLTSLDVSKFDTSKVTSMSNMFGNCSGLTSLDLSNFDTSKVSNMWGMFHDCSELITIYASDKFVTTSIPNDDINCKYKCFYSCKKLVGGAGTTFDASNNDQALAVPYARIDGGTDAPGYFTKNPFVLVKGTTITGSETWTPPSNVFVSERSLTIPDLYVCDHEVTRGEFKALMGEDPSIADAYDKDGKLLTGDYALNNPVTGVNWYAAIAYCNKLSVKEGLDCAYTVSGITDWESLAYSSIPTESNDTWNAAVCDFEADGYRLPTEAEWEWLARGGQNYTYAGSDTVEEVAWYTDNTNDSGSREVKTKAANGYGLYDMSGNVWEWCWDWHGSFSSSTGAASGSYRVVRGGSWNQEAVFCAVSVLNDHIAPYLCGDFLGFRVVRSSSN